MNSADVGALAWALADSANAFMSSADRTTVCAKIGAGEQDSAIRDVLALYGNTEAELPFELAAPIRKWIAGYAGSDSETTLLRVYDRIRVSVASTTGSQPPKPEPYRPPPPLVARRSEPAERIGTNRRCTRAANRVVICGVTTHVDELVDAAVEARRVARAAIEVAVREARSIGWSWDQISAALGGKSDGESLRRRFGPGEAS